MTKLACGIYCITCIPTSKKYIGSSISIYRRIKEHFYRLKRGSHENSYLQRAFNKYGEFNFNIEILLYCDPQNRMNFEQKAIEKIRPEFNGTCIVEGRFCQSPQTKTRMKYSAQERWRKNPMTEEIRKKISVGHKGKSGHPMSEENKAKLIAISKSRKGKPGRPQSTETRAKLSIALKGRPVSEACRFSASLNHPKGHHLSEEHKAKISASNLGRPKEKLRGRPMHENVKKALLAANRR
jgi:group I intron endonuclease